MQKDFFVKEDMQYYNLPHNIEKEKEEIFYGKLKIKLSPPFTDIKLEDVLGGRVDDWKLHLDDGRTIAIKEKSFKFQLKILIKKFYDIWKENKKNYLIDMKKYLIPYPVKKLQD